MTHIATSLSITSLKLLQGSSILECSRGVRGEHGGGVRSSSGQEVEVEEWPDPCLGGVWGSPPPLGEVVVVTTFFFTMAFAGLR